MTLHPSYTLSLSHIRSPSRTKYLKAFRCDICGHAFARKANLKEHEYIHTGEKPFRCDICGRDFRQKHSLVEHQRTHTGFSFFLFLFGNHFSQTSVSASKRTTHHNFSPTQARSRLFVIFVIGPSLLNQIWGTIKERSMVLRASNKL